MFLEVLYFALVLFCLLDCWKRAEVAFFTRRRILFTGIQSIFSGFEFANHVAMDASEKAMCRPANIVQPEIDDMNCRLDRAKRSGETRGFYRSRKT
jgi:hypothetical protein